jgi:hypothetical protein
MLQGPQTDTMGIAMDEMAPHIPWDVANRAMTMMRSLLQREASKSITPRSAQMAMARLIPPLEPARIIPPVNLDNIPTPTSAANYRKAMRAIYRAAVDGKCGLDEARKAMILTKTLWRAELETAGLEEKAK